MKIQYDIFKNPNYLETNQLGIDNRGQGVELGTTENKYSYWSKRDLNLRWRIKGPAYRPLGHALAALKVIFVITFFISEKRPEEDSLIWSLFLVSVVYHCANPKTVEGGVFYCYAISPE